MKTVWNRLTLMRYATDEDDGQIPPMTPIWCALLAAVIWATWAVAVWIVNN